MADGSWFPWPLLLASVARLSVLAEGGVTKVATCLLVDDSIGVMFRRGINGEVTIVQMANGNLEVRQGDMAALQVVEVLAVA